MDVHHHVAELEVLRVLLGDRLGQHVSYLLVGMDLVRQ